MKTITMVLAGLILMSNSVRADQISTMSLDDGSQALILESTSELSSITKLFHLIEEHGVATFDYCVPYNPLFCINKKFGANVIKYHVAISSDEAFIINTYPTGSKILKVSGQSAKIINHGLRKNRMISKSITGISCEKQWDDVTCFVELIDVK